MGTSPNVICPDEKLDLPPRSLAAISPNAVIVTPTLSSRKTIRVIAFPPFEAGNSWTLPQEHATWNSMKRGSNMLELPNLDLNPSHEGVHGEDIEKNEALCTSPRTHRKENSVMEFEGMKFHYLDPSDVQISPSAQRGGTTDYGRGDGAYSAAPFISNESAHSLGEVSGQHDH